MYYFIFDNYNSRNKAILIHNEYLDMLDVSKKEICAFPCPSWFMSDEFASDNYAELAAVM